MTDIEKRLTKEEAKKMSIVSVAESLGMNLVKQGQYYYWSDHDSFVINQKKNMFSWFSKDIHGDVISLVQTINDVTYKEAMIFLSTGEFKENRRVIEQKREPFNYTLEPFEKSFNRAKSYLMYYRGLSEDTIRFFIEKKVLSFAHKKSKDGYEEDVIVFKFLDRQNNIVGASLQGVLQNFERYGNRRYLKQTMFNSQPLSGFNVSIGTPKRLIFFEAPIDLMSYYELHKDQLNNVTLISMEGLKESTIARYFLEFLAIEQGYLNYESDIDQVRDAWKQLVQKTTYFDNLSHQQLLTLAVDNDMAGQSFIEKIKSQGIKCTIDIPQLNNGNDKNDWNDQLKYYKQHDKKMSNQFVMFMNREQQVYQTYSLLQEMLQKREEHQSKYTMFVGDFELSLVSDSVESRQLQKQYSDQWFNQEYQLDTSIKQLENQLEHQITEANELGKDIDMIIDMSLFQTLDSTQNVSQAYKKVSQESIQLKNSLNNAIQERIKLFVNHLTETDKLTVLKDINETIQAIQRNIEKTDYLKKHMRLDGARLNDRGQLEMSVFNIPYIQKDIMAYEKGHKNLSKQTIKQYRKELLALEVMQEMIDRPLTKGAQALIDSGDIKQWDKKPIYYFLKDEKGVALTLNQTGNLEVGDNYQAKTESSQEKVKKLLDKQYSINRRQLADKIKNEEYINDVMPKYYIRFEFSEHPAIRELGEDSILSYESFVSLLYSKNRNSLNDLGYRKTYFDILDDKQQVLTTVRYDVGSETELLGEQFAQLPFGKDLHILDTFIIDKLKNYEQGNDQSKSVDLRDASQEKKSGTSENETIEQQKNKPLTQKRSKVNKSAGDLHHNSDFLDNDLSRTASKPVEDISQPEFPVTAQLQFTIKGELMSTIKKGYHVITPTELKRLNRFATGLQETAQWYLNELSNRTIFYFYQDNQSIGLLTVQFNDENFAHLVGISPKNVTAKQVVYDLARGYGDYENIQVSNAIKSKSVVLPLMTDILSSDAFLFNDLTSIEKMNRIDLSKAIQTDDEEFLLAIRDVDGVGIPASIMKVKETLSMSLQGKEKIILGIYRDGKDVVEQLSINTKYIKDGGKELQDILTTFKNSIQQNKTKEIMVSEDKPMKLIEFDQVTSTKTVSDFLQNNDVKGLNNHLKASLSQYTNSENYRNFLNTMSQFYRYSLNNLLLISQQNPEATIIASYIDWIKKFKRHVKKGEKGLKIWAPCIYTRLDEKGNPLLDDAGKPIKETRFKFVSVFDISQTNGQDLPKAIHLLEGDVIDYENIYRSIRYILSEEKVTISFDVTEPGVNGYYNPSEHKIVISNRGLSQSHIIKTLFHETAHALLHHSINKIDYDRDELQAESIAYIVSKHFNIDSSQFTFGYLHAYSKDKISYTELSEELKTILKTSKKLITRIDETLEKIKNKTLTHDTFLEKLKYAENKQQQLIMNKSENITEKKSQIHL